MRLDAVPNGPDKGCIREVCGTVNYLQPGRSSLISRGLFTMADVAAAVFAVTIRLLTRGRWRTGTSGAWRHTVPP